MTWNLLDKTELRIQPIGLHGAELDTVAATVAGVLGLPAADVTVIDARDDILALDVLRTHLDADALAGRRRDLLTALAELPSVVVDERTAVCAQGVLGWIAADRAEARASLSRAAALADDIERTIASRALVLSTGPEVRDGLITDTNMPWIAGTLRAAGYTVLEGDALPDVLDTIAATLREAGEERGFGLVVTTGGVGAEAKDATVEALLAVDPDAATAPLFAVHAGHGRHVKHEVRIGVGRIGTALVVCLPGPHVEARLGTEELLRALADDRGPGAAPGTVAERIASVLRARLRDRKPV